MKKIGIVSCYFHPNYGSMLQAYATQRILQEWGYPCENICIDGLKKTLNKEKVKFYLKQITDRQILSGTILRIGRKRLQQLCHKKTLGYNLSVRRDKFETFKNDHFIISERYQSMDELSEKCIKYSAILVGSDQLWLPSNIQADYYTLNWVPEQIPKISYATSFGSAFLPENLKKKTRDFLNRFQSISVRETAGVQIIKECTNLDAKLVCDPTLLFTAEEWMNIQKKEPIMEEKYILCYFLGNNKKDRGFAMRLREKTGYKLVALIHLDEYIAADEKYADITPFDVGPSELLNLIRNAEYIVTDSFHGSVFSILNKKIFFTSRRIRKEGVLCTNNRLDSLFDSLDVRGRIIDGSEDIDECLARDIDYYQVHKKLEQFREYSKTYLRDALPDKD